MNTAERDPFRTIASAAQAIENRHREALATLEETPLPAELKQSVERQLAELLAREIHALCEGANVPDEERMSEGVYNIRSTAVHSGESASVSLLVGEE
jgi:hypothetical protein